MKRNYVIAGTIAALAIVVGITAKLHSQDIHKEGAAKPKVLTDATKEGSATISAMPPAAPARLDTVLYDSLIRHLVHDKVTDKWPAKAALPLPGAILPFKRVVAYYGNFYSANMGILGELPPDQMIAKLQGEVKKWQAADPAIPVMPAIHYIAVTAQGKPGAGNMYRLRMPFAQIDKALALAKKINGILILDVQVGHSTVEQEIPQLEPYLKLPNVHLGIDPEFAMHNGKIPSTVIGSLDAKDINYAADYLVTLTKKYNLPPKILVVHRFTEGMVTNALQIKTHPEVQIVMDMDGWGFPAKKVNSYKVAVAKQPVQFTGFKLFYKNDLKTGAKKMMTPEEVLTLYPAPIYIQYQ